MPHGQEWIVLFCLAILLPIFLLIWVYKDAKKREITYPILWALGVLFFGLIVFIVYLVMRENLSQQNKPQLLQ